MKPPFVPDEPDHRDVVLHCGRHGARQHGETRVADDGDDWPLGNDPDRGGIVQLVTGVGELHTVSGDDDRPLGVAEQ